MALIVSSFIIACFFAYNIGASGSAAAMSVSYGTGALKRKWTALILCSAALFAGAVLGSAPVVKTLSKSIIPEQVITPEVVLIILISAAGTLFISNLLSIPLSTSEVTVGAIVGAGLAFQILNVKTLMTIVLFWFFVPLASMTVTFLLVKGGDYFFKGKLNPSAGWRIAGIILLIITGCLEAFAAGMNNVGNAVGPLIGAGIVHLKTGIFTGALFMVAGVLTLGGRVIETSAKRIVKLSVPNGIAVSGISGILVTLASVFGMPIPITQVTTSAIVGVSAAKNGRGVWKQPVITLILRIWFISPILSMVISYFLIESFLKHNFYSVVIIVGVAAATLCMASLAKVNDMKKYLKFRESKIKSSCNLPE